MCRNSALDTEPSAETEIKVAERFNNSPTKSKIDYVIKFISAEKNTSANPTISAELAPEAIAAEISAHRSRLCDTPTESKQKRV